MRVSSLCAGLAGLFTLLMCLNHPLFAQVKVKQVELRQIDHFIGYAPNRIVVKFDETMTANIDRSQMARGRFGLPGLDALGQRYQVTRIRQQFPGARPKTYRGRVVDLSKWYKVRFVAEAEVLGMVEAYKRLPGVLDAQPVGIHAVTVVPNDPNFGDQWHLDQANDADMDAPEAWDIETGSEDVIAAILDTGVRYFHKDLGGGNASIDDINPTDIDGNIWINTDEIFDNGVDDDDNGFVDDWVGWDFVDDISRPYPGEDGDTPDNDPRDFNGHGTHVSGIVAAINNNDYAVASVAGGFGDGTLQPSANGVKIMALRIGWSERFGFFEVGFVAMDFAAEALFYAAENGAKLANGSWGSSDTGGLGEAMDNFIASGGLFFHAAGNDDSDSPDFLGNREDVINVASTDENDAKSDFSNFGDFVDVAAPGSNIWSTYHDHNDPDNDYLAELSGTSMASPNALSVAALIWSQNPGWSADQVKQHLFDTADDIGDTTIGAGRVNAFNAVEGGGTPTPDISVSPTSVDFGDVNVDESSDEIVTVSNDGSADLEVTDLSTTNAVFSVISPSTPFTLTPGASEDVTVRFSPTAEGTQSGDLEITSDDPDEGTVTVGLTGNGVVPPPDEPDIAVDPTSLDFGQVTVADSADATVTVTNNGTQTLTVSDLTTTNSVFSVVSPAAPFDVAADGGTDTVTVRFKPTTESVENGDLEITSNDPDEGLVTVALTGEGVTEPPEPTAFRINAGGDDYTDTNGDLFVADKAYTNGDFGYDGGSTASTTSDIAGTEDDPLYQDYRQGTTFSYLFDLSDGDYEVTCFFMEPRARRTGRRVFDVLAEGQVVVDDLDIVAEAGAQLTAHTETFTINVADGQLNIDFEQVSGPGQPLVCAIAVVSLSGSSANAALARGNVSKDVESEDFEPVPETFGLEQNHPNPFNPSTVIRYHLPQGMRVTLTVYNLLGQTVRTLVNREQPAGSHAVMWDGRDRLGRDVPSGVYLYRLAGDGFVETRKMILLE